MTAVDEVGLANSGLASLAPGADSTLFWVWWLGSSLSLGLVIGSFLNVVIQRMPRGESIAFPGSHCPSCLTPIRALDNVPLLSYLWLRGSCRHCTVQISWRYPAVELLTGLVFTAIAYRFGIAWQTPLWMVFSAGLIVAAAVDIDHQIIPDEISLGGMVVGLVAVPLVLLQTGQDWSAIAYHCGLGAGLGGGLLWIVGFSHARVSVAMGRHFEHWPGEGESLPAPNSLDYWTWFPGLGFGDVKLLAMIGVFLGPVGVMATIVIAAVAGLALGIGWGLATRSFNSPFGFAPAIAAGALVALLVPIRFF